MNLFTSILRMSLIVSILLPVVLLIRFPLQKVSKRMAYLLWIIPAIRLIFPFTLSTSFGLIPGSLFTETGDRLTEREKAINENDISPVPDTAVYENNTEIVISHPEGLLPSDYHLYNPGEKPVIGSPVISESEAHRYNTPDAENTYIDVTDKQIPRSSSPERKGIMTYLFPGWLTGVGIMMAMTALSYIKLKKQLRICRKEEDRIYICDEIDSAFILGIFRPSIYLPSSEDEEHLRYMLAHEKKHLKRGDPFFKFLGFLLLSLHWFNPVIWGAYILFCHDMELACDEAVISRKSSFYRKAYAETLLNLSVKEKALLLGTLSFAEGNVKSRIKAAAAFKKPRMISLLLCLLLLIAAVGCLGTDQNNTVIPITSPSENEDITQSPFGTDETKSEDSTQSPAGTDEAKSQETSPIDPFAAYKLKSAALYLENAEQVIYSPDYQLTYYLGRWNNERIFSAVTSRKKPVLLSYNEGTDSFRIITDYAFIKEKQYTSPEFYPRIINGKVFVYNGSLPSCLYAVDLSAQTAQKLLDDTGYQFTKITDVHNDRLLLQLVSGSNNPVKKFGIYDLKTGKLEVSDIPEEADSDVSSIMMDDNGVWYEIWRYEPSGEVKQAVMYYDFNSKESSACINVSVDDGTGQSKSYMEMDYPSVLPLSGLRDTYLYAVVNKHFGSVYDLLPNNRCIASGRGTLYITAPDHAVINRIRVEALNDPLNQPYPLWYREDPEEVSVIFGGKLYTLKIPSPEEDGFNIEDLWKPSESTPDESETGSDAESDLVLLKNWYPEYFSYDLARGLTILVTPVAKDKYVCRLFNDTISSFPMNELTELPAINPGNMKLVLSALDTENVPVLLRLYRSFDTTYIVPYETVQEVEDCHKAIAALFDNKYEVFSQMIGTSPVDYIETKE